MIDTSALIEIIKGTKKGEEIIKTYGDENMVTTSLTVHESLTGSKESEIKKLKEFFENIIILSYDFKSAEKSAEIEKELASDGRMINKMDILIASICIINNCSLITLDNDFKKIKDLKLVLKN